MIDSKQKVDRAVSDEQILRGAGVRLTAVRLLVWRTIRKEFEGVFNLADLEAKLPTVDKSTLFRTLGLLSEKHLLDTIDDGTGSQKYCLGNADDPLSEVRHIHFSCRVCHRTVCLTNIMLPEVTLPEGFTVEDVEYVVKGICPDCARRSLMV
jgi:Fur family ferric uptake transcriptional regulator